MTIENSYQIDFGKPDYTAIKPLVQNSTKQLIWKNATFFYRYIWHIRAGLLGCPTSKTTFGIDGYTVYIRILTLGEV